MKIIFLGTNGWYSTKTGDSICTLIETEESYVVFDAGEGFRKLNEYITKNLPVYVFLSHLHLDHVYGLHLLSRLKLGNRLKIIIPKSKNRELFQLVDSPYAMSLKKNHVSVIPVETGIIKGLPFKCQCRRLKHRDGVFGYRLQLEGKIIVYCCDTGYSFETIKLADKSDVLIHECTLRSEQYDDNWGHSNPENAATVAKKAQVKKIILTHFMPDLYPTIKSRLAAKRAAQKIFSNVKIATDGLIINI